MTTALKKRGLGERAPRILLTVVFVGAAVMKLTASEFEISNFERFGYAPWFMYAVGIAQLLGAILLWVRGYVAYAALFLAAMMAGGVISHLRAGDPVAMAIPALGLTALLCGLAFARSKFLSEVMRTADDPEVVAKVIVKAATAEAPKRRTWMLVCSVMQDVLPAKDRSCAMGLIRTGRFVGETVGFLT